MAKYLVTGGAGFIGSHLVEAALKRGGKVVVVDDLSSGRVENLEGLGGDVELVRGDVCDLELMKKVMKGVDYVMHEAAIPSVPKSVKEPLICNRAAVDGTLSVLLAARDAGVKRVVYTASSAAYGETQILPKVESMATDPISPYAVAKLTGELYMKVFYKVYGLETVSLRYFNVFGPRQDPNSMYTGVIAKFIRALDKGERPVIFGDGKQTRDFTYIDNVVQLNMLALDVAKGPAIGIMFNAGVGVQTELNHLLALIAKELGKKADPKFEPARSDDIRHSLADISLARKLLGYKPVVSLEEGVARTVRHYLEHEK